MQELSIDNKIQSIGKSNAVDNEQFSTLERSAIKKVIRESWQSEVEDKGETASMLNSHVASMQAFIGTLDYEALCMRQLINTTKHMSESMREEYLHAIESFASAYAQVYHSKKLLSLMLVGIVHSSKSPEAVEKYTNEIFSIAKGRLEAASELEKQNIEKINELMNRISSVKTPLGILFRRKEIRAMEARLDMLTLRQKRLHKKVDKYKIAVINISKFVKKA